MKRGVPSLERRGPQTRGLGWCSGCHKIVRAGLKHTLSAIGQAIERPLRLAVRIQNNVFPGYRYRKRSIGFNPLSGSADAAEVEKIVAQELASARRKERTVGLRDVTLRANDVLGNRVGDEIALHRPAGDELENEVVGPRAKNRFAFVVHDRFARPC